MCIAETVTKMRYRYHLEAIELNNVLNQLGIRSNDKAEECAKKHCMTLFTDIFPRMGYDISSLYEEEEDSD